MPIAHHIRLKPESHRYFDAEGNEYTSVSKILARYKEPFDQRAIAEKVAKRDGITVEEVLKEWGNAAPYGTAVHEQMENFFNFRDAPTDLIEPYRPHLAQWRSQPVTFHPETILYHRDLRLAGTADLLIEKPNGSWSILDWKTNGKIHKEGYKGKKLRGKLSHLDDCNFVHYSLQLNLYAWMLNLPVDKLTIVHIPRGQTRLEMIPCPKLEREVGIIVNDLLDDVLPF